LVKNLHCSSCELLIEKRLLNQENVIRVKASVKDGLVKINYQGNGLKIQDLNRLFKNENYLFSYPSIGSQVSKPPRLKDALSAIMTALLIIIGFVLINQSGLLASVEIKKTSSLPVFFLFGLLAGVSSCAALVGGLVLSMSRQWSWAYSGKESVLTRLEPHLLFNSGRLVSYGLLGALLGSIGSIFKPSPFFSSILVIGTSLLMIILALQMLGIRTFRRIQIALPRSVTGFITNEGNFKARYLPFVMGALTFFLPCGFTLTAQGLATISGSPMQGGLIMFLFALGTLPSLLLISLSGIAFVQKPSRSGLYLKIAGVVVLFFAFFNLNSQLNTLGLPSLSDFRTKKSNASQSIEQNIQVIEMAASAYGYDPSYFKVKVGIPVRWEITDKGTSGCTSAVIAKNLFDGQINLIHGQTSVKEFIPEKPGRYKFNCWMGMVSGIIEIEGWELE